MPGSSPRMTKERMLQSDRSLLLPPAAAAVHVDRIGRHESARVPAEEKNQFARLGGLHEGRHQFADLVRLAEALHRHVLKKALKEFGRLLRRRLERRLDWPRRDRQSTDALAPEFARAAP